MSTRVKLKKIDDGHVDTEGSWAISYGDMITLLLSFFVIFFSFDFQKEKEMKLEKNAIKNISLINASTSNMNGVSENKNVTLEDLSEMSTVITKAHNGSLVVFFKGANFFDTGSIEVNEVGKLLLDKFMEKFVPYAGKFKLKIQAFTDNRPVESTIGRYKDNIELSALRSIDVLRYLQKIGLPTSRVEIGGKGIMNNQTLKLLGIESDNEKEIRKMSRTVGFILTREDA